MTIRFVALALFLLLQTSLQAQVNWDSTRDSEAEITKAEPTDMLGWSKAAHEVLRTCPPYLGGKPVDDGGLALAGVSFAIDGMLGYTSGTLQLHAVTNDAALLDLGDGLYDKLVERLVIRDNDAMRRRPSVAGPLGRAAFLLEKQGRLNDADRKSLRALALLLQKDMSNKGGAADLMDRIRRLEGAAWMTRLFPDDPDLASLKDEVNLRFEHCIQPETLAPLGQRSLEEALCRLLLTGRALKRSVDLRALEPLFQRTRDLVSPSGFPYRSPGENWAPSVLGTHVLEAATRLFADGSYRAAAARNFRIATTWQEARTSGKGGITGQDAHLFFPVLSMPASDISPTAPTNTVPANRDWLILEAGSGPQRAQVVMQLSGPADQRPGIQSYSVAGVPLFRGSAFTDAEAANLLLVQDAELPFPFEMARQERAIEAKTESDTGYTYWGTNGPFLTHCDIAEVKSRTVGQDAFATIRFSSYGAPDRQLTRRLTLTREGVLVICDDLTPGEDDKGALAGPIWHVEEDGPKDLAEGWVFQWPLEILPDYPQAGLLLRFAKQPDDTVATSGASVFDSYHIRKAARGSLAPGRTVSLARSITPGEATRFITALIPTPGTAKAKDIAGAVETTVLPSGAVDVSVLRGKERLFITFAADGTSRVLRNATN